MENRHFALGFAALMVCAPVGAQLPEPSAEADGLVHVELTLDRQLIGVTFSPGLSADDGAEHRRVLAGAVGSRFRVGRLEGHRALRLGAITPLVDQGAAEADDSDAPPTTINYDLFLVRNGSGWELEAHTVDSSAVSLVPLRHRMTDRSFPTMTVALHAIGAESGRLALRWGRHLWSTDFRFEELPPPPRRARVSGRGTERGDDSDPAEIERSAEVARGLLLGERDESALVFTDGRRISLASWKSVDVEDEDYGRLWTTGDGAVVELVRASVLRFKNDVPLRFGEADLPTGNLAAGFAGVYGIWLKRVGDGWRFVFSDEPDSWGTQHDPDFDVAEIPAVYSRGGSSFRPLGATLIATGVNQGRLVVHWGLHQWASDFTVTR
tara:strand:+ start:9031 stop:10173 length:1143 start_codon:yes stop_codon:yes gene_type:complete